MSIIEPRVLKGFRDFDPGMQLSRQLVFQKIQTVFETFGFLPLSTPTLEYKEILMGKYGDDEKLVYHFKDHGDREVAMRYDLTVPLARFIAQNRNWLTFPFKRYHIAPVWRADNTQKGRYREFYQCDVDMVGSNSELADAEVMGCLGKALEAIGITNYKIRVNDRAVFADFSQDAIRIIDKVEKIGVDGMVNEMRARGVSQLEIESATDLVENGGNRKPPERLAKVLSYLEKYNLKGQVVFDPTIARGLDYYSGTVFETVLIDKPEYGSICSGGRYDGLVDQFSKQSLPAVGGSIGVDRLFDALGELGLLPKLPGTQVLVLHLDSAMTDRYIALAQGLRESGISTEIYIEQAKIDKQFKYADAKKITLAIIVGDAEIERGVVQVKNIATREQREVAMANLIEEIKTML